MKAGPHITRRVHMMMKTILSALLSLLLKMVILDSMAAITRLFGAEQTWHRLPLDLGIMAAQDKHGE